MADINDNTLSKDSEVIELETTGFNDGSELYPKEAQVNDLESIKFINKPKLSSSSSHGYGDNNNNNTKEKKNNKFLFLCILLFSVLFCLITGYYVLTENGINNNNNNVDIMADIHRIGQERRAERGNRSNEEECEARRCCDIRDGLTINDLPKGLNCTLLTDDECGYIDEYCQWDCDISIYKLRKKNKFIRHFRRISLFQGRHPKPNTTSYNNNKTDNKTGPESYQQCLNGTKVIIADDCGVEYEEEIDPGLAEIYCQSRDIYKAEFSAAKIVNESLEDDENRRRLPNRVGTITNPTDGRIKVSSPDQYPWRIVFFVTYDKADGTTKRCTGAMISPRWVMTAGHCVWGYGDWYSNLAVYRNVETLADINEANKYHVEYLVTFTDYITYNPGDMTDDWQADNDIGLLRLTGDPDLGYFAFGHDPNFQGTEWFNSISYPDDKEYEKWRQWCSYDYWYTNRMVSSNCDYAGGASGAPIYKNGFIIYGVHAAGTTSGNIAARIDSVHWNAICDHVEVETPALCARGLNPSAVPNP